MKKIIEDICKGIREGRYTNEASVSQGIVLRILDMLGWPTYDTEILSPEYTIEGRRVDYALCNPPKKPVVFVEVKQVGKAEGADRQLFEYAFHTGVPMAVLTDGREWHFFLPGEQGDYSERRVYKLDVLERQSDESLQSLTRYLDYKDVCSGNAIRNARNDYRNIAKKRIIHETLPESLRKLLIEKDDILMELIADKVENLCGYRPEIDDVSDFLDMSAISLSRRTSLIETEVSKQNSEGKHIKPPERKRRMKGTAKNFAATRDLSRPVPSSMSEHGPVGFVLHGEFYPGKSAVDVLINVFLKLQELNAGFFEKFASLEKHGSSRRYLGRSPSELFPSRPDFAEKPTHWREITPGWYLEIHEGKKNIESIIKLACKVEKIMFGSDMLIDLG